MIHHVCVHSLQEMAKRDAEEDREVVIKEALCPECGKKFQRQTDADRHFDMKHLLIKHDCLQCGTTLGSVSALRRHQNTQHQVKLSTRPGALSPNQWRFIPIEETTSQGDMRGTSARRETVQSEPVSQEGSHDPKYAYGFLHGDSSAGGDGRQTEQRICSSCRGPI